MNLDAIWNRSTELLQQYLMEAVEIAKTHKNQYLHPSHLLLAMASKEGEALNLLQRSSGNIKSIIKKANNVIKNYPNIESDDENIYPSSELAKVFNAANAVSKKFNDSYISIDTLLLGLFDTRDKTREILESEGIKKETLTSVISKVRKGNNIDSKNGDTQREFLEKFTIDLTEKARLGKIDPIIGRDDEIRRAIQVLQRRTKNNPVLIGEPGVGKTAIIEGLAQRIINGEAPDGICEKRILSLDIAALIAGAKYKGEFEDRLKGVLNEVTADESIILFIDEIHIMVNAGAGEGSVNAGNMLKPALARGELRCVGATTLDEYRQFIEKDAALERRFQKVYVAEPSVTDTISILRGLKEKYEIHHGITISDAAIVAATKLSDRYITDRNLPDKAIDLIDEAASLIRIEIDSKPEKMDKLYRNIIQIKIEIEALKKNKDDSDATEKLIELNHNLERMEKEYEELNEILRAEKMSLDDSATLKEKIEKAKIEMEHHRRINDFEKMSEFQYGIIPELEEKLKRADSATKIEKFQLLRTEVSTDEISEIVAKWTGIPVEKIGGTEKEKLIAIENELSKKVIGQETATKLVGKAIKRSRAGVADPTKPNGSFLFLGPTGVGKTELTKALSTFLFDTEDAMVRIDMSEYMEKHSVSRLIGAPPGYVGYEEGGLLTEAVRRRPYSVILLDEVEKAHPDVFNILLQVLDDGRLTDSQGRVVDFKNTIIIMTSNLGAHKIQDMINEDYNDIKDEVMKDVRQAFRPEFINRLDEVIIFNPLKEKDIVKIAQIQISILDQRLSENNISITATDEALLEIGKTGFDPIYGARPLKRVIQQLIEDPLSDGILEEKIQAGDELEICLNNNEIEVKNKAT